MGAKLRGGGDGGVKEDGVKGKESICQIKETVGLDNKALEVNTGAILRVRQHVSITVLFPALPPVEGGIIGT